MTYFQPHSRLQAPNFQKEGKNKSSPPPPQPPPARSLGCSPGLSQENVERSRPRPLTLYSASLGDREWGKPQLVPKTQSPLGHTPWGEASWGSRRT